jgi:hypothetical protein
MIEVKNVLSISSLSEVRVANPQNPQFRIDGRDRLNLLPKIILKYP